MFLNVYGRLWAFKKSPIFPDFCHFRLTGVFPQGKPHKNREKLGNPHQMGIQRCTMPTTQQTTN
jgi:hypothetical protein